MSNNVLFEIGLEELPARFIDDAQKQLHDKTDHWLKELRIDYDSLISFSTPRRLAVLIKGISLEQTTIKEETRGPSEQIAKGQDGNWSKAAVGFTKGQGKTTDDIYVKEVKGTSYIFVEKHIEGKPTSVLLPSFKEVIESIQFKQNMRWGEGSFRYARPIRWLVALYEDQVIPFSIANIDTGQTTYGH
jgi:glycyl-tRNA synthetase beta chain